jgi:hypothetical protein
MNAKPMSPGAERLREHLKWIYRPIARQDDPPPDTSPPPFEVLEAGVTIAEWGENRPSKDVLRLLCACGVFD